MKYVVLAASVLALALVGASTGKAATYIPPTVGYLQHDATAWINKRFAFLHENTHVGSARCMKEDSTNFFCAVQLVSPSMGTFNEKYNVTYNQRTGTINWNGSYGG
jgi:hypothetical protein